MQQVFLWIQRKGSRKVFQHSCSVKCLPTELHQAAASTQLLTREGALLITQHKTFILRCLPFPELYGYLHLIDWEAGFLFEIEEELLSSNSFTDNGHKEIFICSVWDIMNIHVLKVHLLLWQTDKQLLTVFPNDWNSCMVDAGQSSC